MASPRSVSSVSNPADNPQPTDACFGSLKDLLKSVNAAFATSTVAHDLPSPLEDSIQSFVYSDPDVDDSTSLRLHDDLQSVFRKHVENPPSDAESKHGAFLQLLLLLRPYLRSMAQKLHWYKVAILPVLDAVGRLRVEISRASTLMVSMLDYDLEEADATLHAKDSTQFVKLLLDGYMAHALDATADGNVYSLESEHIASQFENVLVTFGKKKPKDLMLALDLCIVDSARRVRALALLTVLVRYQPPHLHHVAQTPLIEHLLQCLLIDTSSTVIQLALTALVMFLPHIPTSVKRHLPRLFLIYSRLLCFDQVRKLPTEPITPASKTQDTSETEDQGGEESETAERWQKLFAIEGEDLIPIDMIHFFTFLYGLYPLNFTSFIRRPRRYLKDIRFPRAEQLDLDQDMIRERTAPFRQKHLLHENFYRTTVEEEIEEDQFLHKDASDVVASCIGLVNNVPSDRHRSSSTSSLDTHASRHRPNYHQKIENKDIPADSLLAADDASAVDSILSTTDSLPLLASRGTLTSPSGPLQHRMSHQSLASPSGPIPLAAPSNPHISEHVSVSLTDTAVSTHEALAQDLPTAMLQCKILLLRNDLQYERYLKSQHLSHIGQLQRRHVMDATLMANLETQMALNKTLKSKLTKSDEAYAALKKETSTGRAQSKEFEVKLSSRVRALRDAEKEWIREREELQLDLSRTKGDNDALRKLVVGAESRELQSRQRVAVSDFEVERAREMQKRFEELQDKVKDNESKAWNSETTAVENEEARMKIEGLGMQLRSQQAQAEQAQDALTKQIHGLNARLSGESAQERRDAEVTELVRKANQSLAIRFKTLQDEHIALSHHAAQLEERYGQKGSGASSRGPGTLDGADDHGLDGPASADSRDISPMHPLRPRTPIQASEGAAVELAAASSAPARQSVGGKSFMQRINEGQGLDHSIYQQRKTAHSAESLDKSKAAESSTSSSTAVRQAGAGPKESEGRKKKPRSSGIRGIRGIR